MLYPTVLTGNIDGPTVPNGHTITLNDQSISFSASGNANATQMATQRHPYSNTSVVANTTPTLTVRINVIVPNTIMD